MKTSSEGLTSAKRSLSHFAIGRAVSAIVGVATMLMLVRVLERGDYGFYIALFAAFEIVQLAASPGAYAIAFRYLPEMRDVGQAKNLTNLVVGLSIYRLITLAICGVAIFYAAEPLVNLMGAPNQVAAVQLYVWILVFEGMARFIDVQFESLLQQGMAQISVIARNGAKLIAMASITGFASNEVQLLDWLQLEAITSGIGLVVSASMMSAYVYKRRQDKVQDAKPLDLGRLIRFAVPTYLSQVIYLATGTEMVKLLVNKLIGAGYTATFGFAAALAGTIQRYLPSFLLIGWVRPLFISARQNGRANEDLVNLAGTVIKINLLMLAPIASILGVAGAEVVDILAGGRMPESLPYLNFFIALLVAQTIRTVVSLLGMTLEVGNGSLVATCVSVAGLAVGLLSFSLFGIWALASSLLLAEVLWSGVMILYLRKVGMKYSLPWFAIFKFALSVLTACAVVTLAMQIATEPVGRIASIAAGLLSALICLGVCAALRPFSKSERDLINKLLPLPVFIW